MYSDAHISAAIIENLKRCKMIIRYGIDCDNVDLKAAGEKGIYVCNTPSYGIYDAAEHTFALLLSLAKHIPVADRCTRAVQWNPEKIGKAERLYGKVIGIVGYGQIAHLIAQYARAFSMDVLVYDMFSNEGAAASFGTVVSDLDTLLKRADFVTLHTPLFEETKHMMGMQQFRHMKKEAFLINTASGGLIHENELVYALLTGEIQGAALDVFENEPLSLHSKLLSMDNVVLSPHVARNSTIGTLELHKEVTENVLRVLSGDTPQNIVNKKFLKKGNYVCRF